MPTPPFAVLASRIRLEERRICEALEARRVPWHHLDPRAVTVDLGAKGPVLAGGPEALRGVLDRELAQVRGLCLTRLLADGGVPVCNAPEVAEVCGDKLRTQQALARAGVPQPRAGVAFAVDAGMELVETIGYPAVIKPLAGSWGRLCAKVADPDAARAVLELRAALPNPQQHVVFVQEFVPVRHDLRVLVAGDRVLGAMSRESDDWRHNAALGARVAAHPLDAALGALARDAAAAVGGGVLGVDILEDATGERLVLEVNHVPEFRAFEAATSVDVAAAVVDEALTVAAAR